MAPNRVLIVDDDPHVADLAAQVARKQGFDVAVARTYDEVKQRVLSLEPTLVLLDLRLPGSGSDGVEILRFLADIGCTADVVLMSGADRRVVNAAESLGRAYGVNIKGILLKPFEVSELRAYLAEILPAGALASTIEASPEEDLHRAIRNQELVLYYQPKLALQSGKVIGAEALARWQHPKRGIVPPSDFILLAESTGLILPLTEWVLGEAIRQAKEWRELGFDTEISVNIPPIVLGDVSFPDALEELLKRHNLPGSCLNLELTESGAMNNVVSAMDVLTRLRLKGIALSIDDFGTGYSSLAKLHKLPFTELKIDRSFIQDLDRNQDSQAITDTIIILAQSLGMRVVAEGVENEDVWNLLGRLGCDVAQGYYIGHPMPACEYADWFCDRVSTSPRSGAHARPSVETRPPTRTKRHATVN